ncbi:MAG: tRNA pseudouridine(55) synthase TruB [Rhizobiales bacterium]|nr:tRNA pseudouridine(55) synthase TruB [Hyphomicrobiales bacterium]NRB15240.1 tRNA pseudouridine(55) synthase TruB [Hyphomicrobiales bacterium]
MARRKRGNPVHGWVILDKPYDLGSTQAVNIVRAIFNAQKAGHGGTLDPLATGLLPIALGEATKTVPYVMDGEKQYEFSVRWGEATDTDDVEGDVIATSDHRPTEADIVAILPKFTGLISQVPPKFSAIKINGERAYDLARAGEKVVLKARDIQVDSLELVKIIDAEHAKFKITCGKGTYIRSIARDMALELGSVAHVTHLKRTKVGHFGQNQMISLDKLREISHSAADFAELSQNLISVETALDDIPALAIDRHEKDELKMGRELIPYNSISEYSGEVACLFEGVLIAICECDGVSLKPKRVFNIV